MSFTPATVGASMHRPGLFSLCSLDPFKQTHTRESLQSGTRQKENP
jgi:hypothetical protein